MLFGRLKSLVGVKEDGIPTVESPLSSPNDLSLPDDSNHFEITGTGTVTTVNASAPIQNGRIVYIYKSDNSTMNVTDSGATTTKGQIDLGGGATTFAQTDVFAIRQRSDGSWVRYFQTDN